MTQTVYKVVVRDLYGKDGMYSTTNTVRNWYAVEYKIEEYTVPRIGKLFVFKDVESARRFLKGMAWLRGEHPRILEGEAENPKRLKLIATESFELFWYYKEQKKSVYWCSPSASPKGTLVCDSFIPLRIVK
jgi:hypothetical protein